MTATGRSTDLFVSAADLGTNTVKITHAALQPDGSLVEVRESANTIRLGKGIEETGTIEPSRIEACLTFLKTEENAGRQLGSNAFLGVATEALRVASNGQELLTRIQQETAWKIDLISGDEEARLTYVGLKDRVPASGNVMIVDIGGGSTEVVQILNDAVESSASIHLGSGRLADAFFTANPPGLEALMMASNQAMERIRDIESLRENGDALLFAGGNGVFIQQLVEQLFPGESLSSSTVERLLLHLATTPAQDTASRLGIVEERARVLPAGVAIAFAFLLRTSYETIVGVPSGIRRGLILEFGARL